MKRILIVDDTVTVILSIKMILADYGYEFESAMCGRDALKKAKDNPPDLVLSDLMMPGMDGAELVKNLREMESTKHIPIIMVTTQGKNAVLMHQCFTAGCSDFITKPINSGELLTKLNMHLCRHNARPPMTFRQQHC